MKATLARQAPAIVTAGVVYAGGLIIGTQMELPPAVEKFGGGMVGGSEGSFWLFASHNAPVLALMAFGLITVGLLTVFLLMFNGIMVGTVLVYANESGQLWHALVLLLPHTPFEIAATLLAAAVGFAPISVVTRLAMGRTVYTKTEVRDLGLLLLFALPLVFAAAMVEAWVSPSIIHLIGGVK